MINISMLDAAHPHSIKKFELIESYVMAWAQKLINYPKCSGLIYIDCMCNSGFYRSDDNEIVEGTPIRVVKVLEDVMCNHPDKQCWVYFSDLESWKIDVLKANLPQVSGNVHIEILVMDGNDLLRTIGNKLSPGLSVSYLMVYDPFEAEIDWSAIMPFFKGWGEVILNHMVLDSVRSVKMVKRTEKIEKYERTYLTNIEKLISMGSDKDAFEQRIEYIIRTLRGSRRYYIAAYPFFNSKNSIQYNLIHCTGHIEGFRLYKKTAWKTFGDRSSSKNTHGAENEFVMDFENGGVTTQTDTHCYNLNDLIKYVKNHFKGKKSISIDEIYGLLDEHPVFPSDGYKTQIKKMLKEDSGVTEVTKGKVFSF